MLKIEITGNNQTKKSKAGNDYTLQEAYVTLPAHKYPVRIEVLPQRDKPIYAPGHYLLALESFKVGEYGKIEVNPILTPAPKGN